MYVMNLMLWIETSMTINIFIFYDMIKIYNLQIKMNNIKLITMIIRFKVN